jgi:hypothetical protein
MQELNAALYSNLEVVRQIFQEVNEEVRPRSMIQLLSSPAQIQRPVVTAAEQSPQFSALFKQFQETSAPKLTLLEWDTDLLRFFFGCSRTYASLFSGKSIDTSAITDALQEALGTPTHRVTYQLC